MRMHRGWVVLLVALLAFGERGAWAQAECRAIAGGGAALERIDAQERIDFIRQSLRRGARDARIWHYTWAGIYSALTTYQLVSIPLVDHDKRVDNYFGLGGSLLGLSVLMISPLKVISDHGRLERRLASSSPDEDPCAVLADAERLLLRDADNERFGKSPLVHVGNVVLNVGLALGLGLGFDHWQQAAISGSVGIVVGEIQSISQPSRSAQALARYRRGQLSREAERAPLAVSVLPLLTRESAGLELVAVF